MNKKILIGSILVLTLFLLMPSIPAIQQKTIEETAYHDLIEQLDFNDVKELKELEQIKHPFLYALVMVLLNCRWIRYEILKDVSYKAPRGRRYINYPILFLRGVMLFSTTLFWEYFWEDISDTLGWNWEIPHRYL